MKPADLLKNILTDTKVALKDEFDKNFERKGFFNDKWKQPKLTNNRGSVMARSGNLRKGLKARVSGNSVVFSNSMPYAQIHNEGGEIVVTAKMKRFFWAMYYKAHNAGNLFSIKRKKKVNNQRTRQLSQEAQQWKALALMKVGQKMKIEQRQFIGEHPQVTQKIEDIVKFNVEEYNKQLFKNLKK